jgi:hypothetical protein
LGDGAWGWDKGYEEEREEMKRKEGKVEAVLGN